MLWNRYCLFRVSVRYRGRAVPVAWRVIEHNSSSVSLEVYKQLLRRTSRLLPSHVRVRFMADRGFADTSLMKSQMVFNLNNLCFVPRSPYLAYV
jgi:hypothetical protein